MTEEEGRRPRAEEQAAAPGEPAAPVGTGAPWRLVAFLLLAVVVVVFAVQNTQAVELHFLGWTWQLPLVIILLVSVVVSVLLDEIVGGILKRRRVRRRQDREELRRLRGEG